MITYICGTNGIRYREYPKAFWEDVNSLMAEGGEILLGDSTFDHRVYGRCRNKQYENVSVMRYFPPRHSFPLSRIKAEIPSRVKMMKKCDRMIAVWDGESEDVFLNLLLLAALNKKCKLYHLPSGSCVEIGTIEDIKPFVAECHGWTDEDMVYVLRKCGFSKEMVAHNAACCKSERYIAEIICKAPVSLKVKFDMLEDLRKKNSIKYDSFINVSKLIAQGAPFDRIEQTVCDVMGDYGMCLDECCAAIKNAEFDLENNDLFYEKCVYYLFTEWYDTDVYWVKSYPLGVFASKKDVMRYMKLNDEYENDPDAYSDDWDNGYECATWYKLEAWRFSDNGAWANCRYDYYFYKGEVCWFKKLHLVREKNGLKHYSPCACAQRFIGGFKDLNMPTPYKPGDIVNIDCMPFGPPFHAVITEAHNQYDCCMPQILFKVPFTDKWQLQALKHKRFYKDAEMNSYEPALSPLYRIRRVREDELTKDDELLVRFSKELGGSEEKARAFYDEWSKLSGWEQSEEVVVGIWDNMREADEK